MIVTLMPFFYCVCVVMARGASESSLRTTTMTTMTMATSPTNLLTTTARTTLSPEEVIESREARGMMMMDYDHDMGDDDHDEEEMVKNMVEEQEESKAVKTDPWAGYYDFLINEGSFKFWAVFQLGTAVLLIYSAFAAVYYAKFNPLSSDYDYYDDMFKRRSSARSSSTSPSGSWFGLDGPTFQRIIDAITSKKYS